MGTGRDDGRGSARGDGGGVVSWWAWALIGAAILGAGFVALCYLVGSAANIDHRWDGKP